MNEFTMKGFTKYTDQELEAIDLKRINRIGYKTSNFTAYKQPEASKSLEEAQKALQQQVVDRMNEQGSNFRYYWEKWPVNTGASKFKNPDEETCAADILDSRKGQRDAIIDFMIDLGIDPDKFNDVSLEELRKMAIRAGA